jgi:hypothetical protein
VESRSRVVLHRSREHGRRLERYLPGL